MIKVAKVLVLLTMATAVPAYSQTAAPSAPGAPSSHPAMPVPSPAASSTPSAPAPAAATTQAPSQPAAPGPASAPSPRGTKSPRTLAANQFTTEQAAKAHCPGDTIVWVNLGGSKNYHTSSERYYGKTRRGAYMCQKEAEAAGYHPPRHRPSRAAAKSTSAKSPQ